jgi:hypothetical protein
MEKIRFLKSLFIKWQDVTQLRQTILKENGIGAILLTVVYRGTLCGQIIYSFQTAVSAIHVMAPLYSYLLG